MGGKVFVPEEHGFLSNGAHTHTHLSIYITAQVNFRSACLSIFSCVCMCVCVCVCACVCACFFGISFCWVIATAPSPIVAGHRLTVAQGDAQRAPAIGR